MSNDADISALSEFFLTTPLSLLCPNAKERASIKIDFPAPVSPVKTEKPSEKFRLSSPTIT